MRRLLSAALVLPCMLAFSDKTRPAEGTNKKQAAAELAKATELIAFEAPGSLPFRLRARVRAMGLKGPDANGAYLLAWAAPARFREEISLASFHEINVAAGDKLWQARNLGYRPLRAWQTLSLVHLVGQLATDSDDRLSKVTGSGNCTKVERNEMNYWHLCLDPTTGAPVRLTYYNPDERYEYGDFAIVGTKYFPQELRAFRRDALVLEARIEHVEQVAHLPEGALTPPVHGTARAWCPQPSSPRPIHYTMGPVGHPHVRGPATVALTATIGTDGRIHNLIVLESPSGSAALPLPAFTGSFITATCNGKPIEQEVLWWIGELK